MGQSFFRVCPQWVIMEMEINFTWVNPPNEMLRKLY